MLNLFELLNTRYVFKFSCDHVHLWYYQIEGPIINFNDGISQKGIFVFVTLLIWIYVLPIYQQSNFYVLAVTSNQRRYMIGPIQCKILNKCPWDVCLINETGLNEKLHKVYCTILTAFKISIRWSSTLKFYFFFICGFIYLDLLL